MTNDGQPMDVTIDYAKIGDYKNIPLFLFRKGNNYFIAFGSPQGYQYWMNALENINKTRPGYSFETPEHITIVVDELQPILAKTRRIIENF